MIKVLVVIANYGMKNNGYLGRVIKEYAGMSYPIDIIVLSDQQKHFGNGISVQVGLPTGNPWSLPYGHKEIFAKNKDQYDLFIYSEDDILIKQNNIDAFLRASSVLPFNMIPGFIRYEIDQSGNQFYSTIHSHWHWNPSSIQKIDEYTFAEFDNYHAGCYIITRDHLHHALKSGKYLAPPRMGTYGMLETAATDIYTQCGFTKTIPISHVDEFSLWHLPNSYIGIMGIEKAILLTQIEAIKQIERKIKPDCKLFDTQTKCTSWLLKRNYYEPANHEVAEFMQTAVRSVLSIGCGWGETESELIKRNISVTAIPIDAIIGACAEQKGVKTVFPGFEQAFCELNGKKYDGLYLSNVLQYLPNPDEILKRALELLTEEGMVVIATQNMNHISIWWKRFLGPNIFRELKDVGNYKKSGLNYVSFKIIKKWLDWSGLKIEGVLWRNIRITTSLKEKNWPLEGGMQILRKGRVCGQGKNNIHKYFTNTLYGLFSYNIIIIAKRKRKDD